MAQAPEVRKSLCFKFDMNHDLLCFTSPIIKLTYVQKGVYIASIFLNYREILTEYWYMHYADNGGNQIKSS